MNAQIPISHPRPASQNARFWDRIAPRYAAKPIADMDSYMRKLELTRSYLRPDMHVLELGCGTGGTALAHAPYVQHVTATDISPEMLKIAEERRLESGMDNVKFEVASIEDFVSAPERFDVVLMLSLLHLLDDPEAAIAKVHRLLKPGGLLVTSTACLGDNMRWFGPIAKVGAAFGLIPRLRIIAKSELRSMMQQRGFAAVDSFEQADGRTYFQIARRLA